MEILAERLTAAGNLEYYIGRSYSNGWVRRNVLKQTDEDIRQWDAEMEEEARKAAEKGDGEDGEEGGNDYTGADYGDGDDANDNDSQNANDKPQQQGPAQPPIKPVAQMPTQAMVPGVDAGAYQKEEDLLIYEENDDE